MDGIRLKDQTAFFTYIIYTLVLRIMFLKLDQRITNHHMIILVRSHKAGQYNGAGQTALIGKGRGFRTENNRIILSFFHTGISDSLAGVSKVAKVLVAAVWIIALGIMVAAFMMMTGERKKEFAVLRVLGASRKKLSRIVLAEGFIISLAGSVIGVAVGLITIPAFSGAIEDRLGLPFLMPKVPVILLSAACALVLSALTGALTSAIAARRIAKIDTGTILRSGE